MARPKKQQTQFCRKLSRKKTVLQGKVITA
jgi:hypothetical protein